MKELRILILEKFTSIRYFITYLKKVISENSIQQIQIAILRFHVLFLPRSFYARFSSPKQL